MDGPQDYFSYWFLFSNENGNIYMYYHMVFHKCQLPFLAEFPTGMLYPDIILLFSRSEDHVENRGTTSAAVWVMPSARWLSVGPSCLPITPTPLCQGGTESTVSQGASLKPSQLVLEDSMWRAVGCNSLVHCPFFLAMVIVGKEADS